MDHDGDAGLVHPGPEGVELVGRRRAWARRRHGRRGPEDHAAGILVQGPFELTDRFVHVGQRDVGGGEDPVAIRHAPVLGQPAVERPEQQDDRFGVVAQGFFIEHAQRGEQPDLRDALRVHHGQAGVAVPVLGPDRLGLSHQLVHGHTVRIAPEVVEERARRRDRVEGRVGDGVVDAATDGVVAPAVDFGPLDHPRPQRRVEVAGERIERLVVVVVGVEHADSRACAWSAFPGRRGVPQHPDCISWAAAARPP